MGQPAQLGEAAHYRRIKQGFFHRRVAQGVPLLKEVDAQHRGQWVGLATRAAQRLVVQLDHHQQRLPGHHLFHLSQKQLPARLLALAQVLGVTECQPSIVIQMGVHYCRRHRPSCSEFP
jgi:hypothetical protein